MGYDDCESKIVWENGYTKIFEIKWIWKVMLIKNKFLLAKESLHFIWGKYFLWLHLLLWLLLLIPKEKASSRTRLDTESHNLMWSKKVYYNSRYALLKMFDSKMVCVMQMLQYIHVLRWKYIYILSGKLTIKYFKLEKWDVTPNQNKYWNQNHKPLN